MPWEEWKHHVLAELKRISDSQDRILMMLEHSREEIAGLKVRASVWGGMSAAVVLLGVSIAKYISEGG